MQAALASRLAIAIEHFLAPPELKFDIVYSDRVTTEKKKNCRCESVTWQNKNLCRVFRSNKI